MWQRRTAYAERDPITVASVEFGGIRTLLIVPMLKDNELVGAFTFTDRRFVPSLTNKSNLLTNFAAQAVIAIENARLLNELRQRTDDLTERTATSPKRWSNRPQRPKCFRSSASSPGDLQPVFDTMLENATRICEAKFGTLLALTATTFSMRWRRYGTPPGAFRRTSKRRDRTSPTSPAVPIGTGREAGHVQIHA